MALSRDRFNEEWLKYNDVDEPALVFPEPCGNCTHTKLTHDDATHECKMPSCPCRGWIPYIERDIEDELHRIYSEHDRPEAKF